MIQYSAFHLTTWEAWLRTGVLGRKRSRVTAEESDGPKTQRDPPSHEDVAIRIISPREFTRIHSQKAGCLLYPASISSAKLSQGKSSRSENH